MQGNGTAATYPNLSTPGICVADGYGIAITVHRKHLMVADGICDERRARRFHRATSKLRRVVLVGHEGYVTLEALRWITDVGAALVQIDRGGNVITVAGSLGLDDPRLRRAQALAPTAPVGLEVARYLLGSKLEGQARVLSRMAAGEDSVREVARAIEGLAGAHTPADFRQVEAAGALAYWREWSDVPLGFARADEARVPEHWRAFGQRSSPLTGSPRTAANPANAVLNYLYALLEAECRIACLTIGLDPGLGIIHADQKARDSLALDLMEAVRPQVDTYVLDLLSSHVFRARDFYETRQGACRVLAPLTHVLAETLPAWRRAVSPVAERVTKVLADSSASRFRAPTRLTQDARSGGRDGIRRGPRRDSSALPKPLPTGCRSCGVLLEEPDRAYCDVCLPERHVEQARAFTAAGQTALARLRAQGIDPSQSPVAKRKMGQANARRRAEELAWDARHEGSDPEVFKREVLPAIQGVPLSGLASATGLSIQHCGLIRRGLRVPHPRHWPALRALDFRRAAIDSPRHPCDLC